MFELILSAIISAIIAITVLLLNQWFVRRQARNELFINKIEKMLIIAYEFEDAGNTFLCKNWEKLVKGYLNFQEDVEALVQFNSVTDALLKIQMYMDLYFRKTKFNKNKYSFHVLIKEKGLEGDLQKYMDKVHEHAEEIKSILIELSNKYYYNKNINTCVNDQAKKIKSILIELRNKHFH